MVRCADLGAELEAAWSASKECVCYGQPQLPKQTLPSKAIQATSSSAPWSAHLTHDRAEAGGRQDSGTAAPAGVWRERRVRPLRPARTQQCHPGWRTRWLQARLPGPAGLGWARWAPPPSGPEKRHALGLQGTPHVAVHGQIQARCRPGHPSVTWLMEHTYMCQIVHAAGRAAGTATSSWLGQVGSSEAPPWRLPARGQHTLSVQLTPVCWLQSVQAWGRHDRHALLPASASFAAGSWTMTAGPRQGQLPQPRLALCKEVWIGTPRAG